MTPPIDAATLTDPDRALSYLEEISPQMRGCAILTEDGEVLAASGLVRSARRGRERVWELKPNRLADAHEYLDRISQQWDRALDRLKRFVED